MSDDSTETARNEETAREASPTASQVTEDKGTFVPLIFGGAFATALGFFAGQLDGVERALGLAPPDSGLRELVDAQAGQLAAQQEHIDTLEARLENLPPPPPPVDLSGLETSLQTQQSSLGDVMERLVTLEKRPMTEGLSEEAIAAYEAELEKLQSAVLEQRAEVEALLQQAKDSEGLAAKQARMAQARAAMTQIITSVESGAPFSAALTELEAIGGADIASVLKDNAEKGVPTLSSLQSEFPEFARKALAAARTESTEGGLGAFLERQLGARSITPQEGDGADAILSRAEFAVKAGQLGDALTELGALPDAALAEITGWTGNAETRVAAKQAAQDLMSALSTN